MAAFIARRINLKNVPICPRFPFLCTTTINVPFSRTPTINMRMLVVSLRVILAINSTCEDGDDTNDTSASDAFADDANAVTNDEWR